MLRIEPKCAAFVSDRCWLFVPLCGNQAKRAIPSAAQLLVSFISNCIIPFQCSFGYANSATRASSGLPMSSSVADVDPGISAVLLGVVSAMAGFRCGMLLQKLEDEIVWGMGEWR